MGNQQSRTPYTGRGVHDGPLFGGHYASDFSLSRGAPVNCQKPLPDTPTPRGVRFGHQPPAWEFYRGTPTWDNTANTRYCPPSQSAHDTHPQVFYGAQGMQKTMHVVNP